MDELAKALAEAIRAGTHIAGPALMGYYAVRICDIIFPVIGWIIVVAIISRTIVLGIKTGMSYGTEASKARTEAFRAWREAHREGYERPY